MPEKLIVNVNASSLRYAHCLRAWYATIVSGYVQPVFSDKIVYGIALHKFIDTMYKTGDMMKAKDAGLAEFRQKKLMDDKAQHLSDEGHFIWTCFDVWNNFALVDPEFEIVLKPDGTPATEVTFKIPFYEDDNLVANVCGTIDKIGRIKNGCDAIGDWKSTSTWNSKEYLSNYRMSHQLRFYTLACKLMARHFPESTLGKIGATRMGAFIDGVFLKQKAVETKVIRSDVFVFDKQDMEMFENTLTRRLTELSRAIGDGTVDYKEGIIKNTCELKYNKCPFWAVCAAHNPAIEKLMLKQHFDQRPYDPLNRDKAI